MKHKHEYLLKALQEALDAMEADWEAIDGEWGPFMEEFGDLEGAIQQCHPSTEVIRNTRAAIAKATGKQK